MSRTSFLDRKSLHPIAALLAASIGSFPLACGDDVADPGSGDTGGAGGSPYSGTTGGFGGLSGTGAFATSGSTGLGGMSSSASGGFSAAAGANGGRFGRGTGGSLGSGGVQSSGGFTSATGGSAATGGSSSSGGATSSGGETSSGGATSSGGSAASGGASNACTEPDKTVCNNEIAPHCGYTYEYWKDQGSGCLVSTSDGFSVEWNGINNLLGRKGVRPGSTNQIVTYDADYRPNGNSYLCVYGWTKNPLVEYYIVDSWGSWRPPGGTSMGTVDSDGGTYDIYRTQRVEQPSIEGTRTFYQYWSVRTQKRTSGTITVANHFNAWASRGMNMGSLYEVSMTVEGYQSSGTADVSFSMN